MSDEQHDIEHPPPFGEVPPEFEDPEGDGELADVELEGTADMRREWKDWFCGKGPGKFVDVKFFGKSIGGVPAPAVDAYEALEAALASAGYQPKRSWSNKCRKIAGSKHYSLHSYGIAIDIDPKLNPYTEGSAYAGKLQRGHVAAVLAIKNTEGRRIWSWGGNWKKPDRMHFQLDQGPDGVAVDPSTIPDGSATAGSEGAGVAAAPGPLEGATHGVAATSLNVRSEPSTRGSKVAALPSGTQVIVTATDRREADGYEWVQIEAGGGIAGWVASKYLDPIAGAPSSRVKPTHTVTAKPDLNMRDAPSTSGTVVAELPTGARVVADAGSAVEADGYTWVKVTTDSGDGWVASKYLESIG